MSLSSEVSLSSLMHVPVFSICFNYSLCAITILRKDVYLFKWSSRKRKVTRLGSGRDSSRLSMQLSLATLSDRAARRMHNMNMLVSKHQFITSWPMKVMWTLVKQEAVTNQCPQQSLGTTHRWKEALAAHGNTASVFPRWHLHPSPASWETHPYCLQGRWHNSQ